MTEFEIFVLILLCICAGCLITIAQQLASLHRTIAANSSEEDDDSI